MATIVKRGPTSPYKACLWEAPAFSRDANYSDVPALLRVDVQANFGLAAQASVRRHTR